MIERDNLARIVFNAGWTTMGNSRDIADAVLAAGYHRDLDTIPVPATAIRVSGGPQNDEGGYSEEDVTPIVGTSPFIVTRVRK